MQLVLTTGEDQHILPSFKSLVRLEYAKGIKQL